MFAPFTAVNHLSPPADLLEDLTAHREAFDEIVGE